MDLWVKKLKEARIITLEKRKKEFIDRIIKDIIVKDIWTLYKTEEKKRKKEISDRLIKSQIFRDIKTLCEQ